MRSNLKLRAEPTNNFWHANPDEQATPLPSDRSTGVIIGTSHQYQMPVTAERGGTN